MTNNLPVKSHEKLVVKIGQLKTPFCFSNRTSSSRSLLELRTGSSSPNKHNLPGAIFDFDLKQKRENYLFLTMLEISEDVDLAYALSLQEELDQEQKNGESNYFKAAIPFTSSKNVAPVSVVDESWELIDPIPDIRQLFLQFNDVYFKGLLGSVEVKWSPRMTL